MRTVRLSNSNKLFTIDGKHYPSVTRCKWYLGVKLIKDTRNNYVLSRYIMELEGHNLKNKAVLYLDGNIYNNTVKNLLVLDLACRSRLTSTRKKTNTSGYIGVSITKSKKWASQIHFRGTKYYLGSFSTKTQAAKAYNEKLKTFPVPEECKVYNVI